MISIVTTYKNRRPHIESTLPTWLQQKYNHPYEIVVVDYDTDDDVSEFLSVQKTASSTITHIRCSKCPFFMLSHARNIGANYASGDWLFYVDIDCCLSDTAFEAIDQLISGYPMGYYFSAVDAEVRKDIINGGLMLVNKAHHMKICGFNEKMIGWGFEDIDYRQRMEKIGLTWKQLPESIYACMDHDDSKRVDEYKIDKELSWTRNRQISLTTWQDARFGHWSDIEIKRYKNV